jgi:hypothetical protein
MSSIDESEEPSDLSEESPSKVSKVPSLLSQVVAEEEVSSAESSNISDNDIAEIQEIIRKKVQVESIR